MALPFRPCCSRLARCRFYGTPTVNYSYDALGNMASETDWLGNEVAFGHDGDGNLTSQDNAVSALNPNGTSSTTYSYDNADYNASASSSVASSCGVTQSFEGSPGSRNADGQVTEDYETFTGSCWGQCSYERNYSYNTAGQLVYLGSVAQGASSANFGYNVAGALNLISSHAASGGSLETYNETPGATEAWAVTAQSPIAGSGGATSSYGYDTLGDLASVTSGSSTTTYGYDSIAQMASLTSGRATTSYQ
jgi:YD repeat-containing protein